MQIYSYTTRIHADIFYIECIMQISLYTTRLHADTFTHNAITCSYFCVWFEYMQKCFVQHEYMHIYLWTVWLHTYTFLYRSATYIYICVQIGYIQIFLCKGCYIQISLCTEWLHANKWPWLTSSPPSMYPVFQNTDERAPWLYLSLLSCMDTTSREGAWQAKKPAISNYLLNTIRPQ